MAVDHYNVYLDDIIIASVPAPLTQDVITGLPHGSLHLVQITAVDAAGNESAKSGIATFLVPPDVIVTPPDTPTAFAKARVFPTVQTLESPQLHYPFRFGPNGFALDETDTPDEYQSIAWLTLRTPPGHRPEAPDIGMPDPTFTLHPGRIVDTSIARADDRIAALSGEQRDQLEDSIVRIVTRIQAAQA